MRMRKTPGGRRSNRSGIPFPEWAAAYNTVWLREKEQPDDQYGKCGVLSHPRIFQLGRSPRPVSTVGYPHPPSTLRSRNLDISNLPVWQYGLIIGGVLLFLGLLLYFLGVRKVKVAPVVPAGFGGIAAGLAAGVIWLGAFGYKPVGTADEGVAPEAETKSAGAPKMGGFPKAGGGLPKGGGGAPPGPRVQLINLINALDVLVDRPVAVTLTAEDRTAISAQLRGLDAATEIKEDEARAKVDAILKVLEKDRKAMEAIGYRWPTADPKAPKGGPPAPPPSALTDSPNPFHAPQVSARLKSVQERLAK